MTGPDHPRRRGRSAALAIVAAVFLAGVSPAPAANPLGRDDEPVVLAGENLPAFLAASPAHIVGFRWSGGWVQIPVQVDEREWMDIGRIYGTDPLGRSVHVYTDPDTFTGPDSDPGFDADDEVVFLAGEAGDAAPAGAPAGVDPASRTDLTLTHPDSGARAYVVLFLTDGSLDPGAGAPPIDCTLGLLSGSYTETYDTGSGPNPEDTRIRTPYYEAHFSDRWIRDEMIVHAGDATGVDILDRHKFLFAPRQCQRSEDTFSRGAGAIVVHKSGPVRGLRGYIGANSGPATHRTNAFYPRREVVSTVVQVHAIPGAMDFLDHSAEAIGMTWRNDVVVDPVPIDGVQDVVPLDGSSWELIEGPQGSIASTYRLDTNIPGIVPSTYWSDDADPSQPTCTGDGVEYGAHGTWIRQGLPNTDTNNPDAYRLTTVRAIAYGPPGEGAAFAEALFDSLHRPLQVEVAGAPECPDGDGDGWVACETGCVPPAGAQCGECDDGDGAVHPGATEVCNGTDDDCDGAVDEDLATTTWWRDADGDGYGDPAIAQTTCGGSPGAGWVDNGDDCDDARASDNPGATEFDCADGRDNDCDGLIDDADPECDAGVPECPDGDGDGWVACETGCVPPAGAQCGECDDARASDHPGATEFDCADGRDNDCDGLVDAEDDECAGTCDADGDGFGEAGCDPNGSGTGVDCDDADPDVHPGAPEWCDGTDRDCSGTVDDPACVDYDLDRSGRVDGVELTRLGRAFGTCDGAPGAPTHPADFDRDGCVDGTDLAILGAVWARACEGPLLVCD